MPLEEARAAAILRIVRLVTASPWSLRAGDRDGLDDATVLHVVVLSSFFGYLNRVADAVGVELDYEVGDRPPVADPQTPWWPRPEPDERPLPREVDLSLRPGAADLIAGWRAYLFDRDAPLPRAHRNLIAGVVADATGDAGVPVRASDGPRERALADFAESIARAPWRSGAETLAPLRAVGLDDAALFDAIATAAHQSFVSRMAVALAAMAD